MWPTTCETMQALLQTRHMLNWHITIYLIHLHVRITVLLVSIVIIVCFHVGSIILYSVAYFSVVYFSVE